MQGLLLEVIQTAAPETYAQRVKRVGIVNAFMDKNFAEAVRATGILIVKQVFKKNKFAVTMLTEYFRRHEKSDRSGCYHRCMPGASSSFHAGRGIPYKSLSLQFRCEHNE